MAVREAAEPSKRESFSSIGVEVSNSRPPSPAVSDEEQQGIEINYDSSNNPDDLGNAEAYHTQCHLRLVEQDQEYRLQTDTQNEDIDPLWQELQGDLQEENNMEVSAGIIAEPTETTHHEDDQSGENQSDGDVGRSEQRNLEDGQTRRET